MLNLLKSDVNIDRPLACQPSILVRCAEGRRSQVAGRRVVPLCSVSSVISYRNSEASADGQMKSGQNLKTSNLMKRKNRGKEIVFDPEDRRKYLQGFSQRKQQRRAFGLAMQKVKDRQARLHDRREHKKSELERIVEAERQRRTLQEDALLGRIEKVDDVANAVLIEKAKISTYQDEASTEKWGGQVIVTTTLASMSDASDEELQIVKVKQSVDKRQRYAGDVSKFINRMKGNLPAKKKTTRSQPRKGNHGAANMSGIGGAANLKLAKKALSKVQAKVGVPEGGKGRGKRRRK